MANLTLPGPRVPIGKMECPHCQKTHQVHVDDIWFQKLTEWLKRTNLATVSDLTVTATSDTNLRFSYVGSDGVTRVADLTLA
jgi:hypothetical protein